jgi:hypothetical protein
MLQITVLMKAVRHTGVTGSLCGLLVLAFLLAQRTAHAQGTPPTNGLVLHWTMDEGSGTQLADASGAGNTASISGNFAWSEAGRIGKCLEGTAQPWTAGTASLNWQPSAFSVAFWINPASFPTYNNFLFSGAGWNGFVFHTDPNGGVYVGTDVSTRMAPGDLPWNLMQAGRWQHITFTYGAGTGRFYRDGVLLASKPMTAPVAWGGFYMSGSWEGASLNGKIDDMRIYGRALTAQEVSVLSAQPNGPVVAIWNPDAATTDWNTPTNWLGGAVPGAASEVVVNNCNTCPKLAANTIVQDLTTNSGSKIDCGGFTLTVNGKTTINAGNISNGTLLAQGWMTSFGTWWGAPVLDATVTVNSPNINNIINTTFNRPVSITKNGGGFDYCAGNNTFNAPTSITLAGGVTLVMALYMGDTFNADLAINNFLNSGDYGISFAWAGENRFNGDVTLSGVGAFGFGAAGGTSVLAAGKAFKTKPNDFYPWSLRLANFTNLSTLPVVLEAPGLAGYNGGGWVIFDNCVFSGDLRVWAYQLAYTRCTFYRRSLLHKMTWWNGVAPEARLPDWPGEWTMSGPQLPHSPVDNNGIGVNTFYGPVAIQGYNNTISGWWNSNNRSVFKENVTINNSGGQFEVSAGTTGDTFHKNLALIGNGVYFRFGVFGATSTFLDGATIVDGGLWWDGGPHSWWDLNIERTLFKGSTARSLSVGVPLRLGTGVTSESPLSVVAPRVYLNGGRFLKPLTVTKTAGWDDQSVGGNVFKDKVIIRNQAASGSLQMATQLPDVLDKGN